MLHGGILWADPLPSGGTRVAFCIPERSPLLEARPNGHAPAKPVVKRYAEMPSLRAIETAEEPADATTPEPPAEESENELSSLLQQLIQE